MKGNRKFLAMVVAAMGLIFLGGCGPKPEILDFTGQTPSGYITADRGLDDEAVFSDEVCSKDLGQSGSAMDFLKGLVARGWRHTGSQGARCGAAYVRDAFAAMGYQVSEQTYSFPYYQFEMKNTKLTRDRDGKKYEAMPVIYSLKMDGPITAQVVKPKGDLKGKIVYATIWDWIAPFQKRMREWKQAGAVGVMFDSDLRPMVNISGDITPCPPFGISGMMPWWPTWRYTHLPGVVALNAKELIGETVTMYDDGRIVRGQGYNVIAWSGKEADSYVLVTGHFDSWFEGAWDDGTGTAALLEMARLMKDDSQGMIFLAVDGEEPGLVGSAAYVHKFGMKNIKAVIEFDGSSGRDKLLGKVRTMPHMAMVSDGLQGFVSKNLKKFTAGCLVAPMKLYRKISPVLSSDSFWFEGAGIPAVWFASVPVSYYHSRKDTIEKIPAEDLEELAVNSVGLARALREAKSLTAPTTVLKMDFEVSTATGDEVLLKATVPDMGGRGKVTVICLYQLGIEKEVVLKKTSDGSFQANFKPNMPGEWEFLAIARDGNKFAKQWAVFSKE